MTDISVPLNTQRSNPLGHDTGIRGLDQVIHICSLCQYSSVSPLKVFENVNGPITLQI